MGVLEQIIFGEQVAKENNLSLHVFFADWKKFGKAAGPIRNVKMAKYADSCVLFPGVSGTCSMKLIARKFGLIVKEY